MSSTVAISQTSPLDNFGGLTQNVTIGENSNNTGSGTASLFAGTQAQSGPGWANTAAPAAPTAGNVAASTTKPWYVWVAVAAAAYYGLKKWGG